jgi:O-antigen ligase
MSLFAFSNRLSMNRIRWPIRITRFFHQDESSNGGFIFLALFLGVILSFLITRNVTMSIVFLGGIAAQVLFCIYPLAGLYSILALSVWVQLLFPQDPEVFGITGVKIIGWAAFVGWLYNIFITRKDKIRRTGLGGLILAIILMGIFSAGWARELPFLWRKVFTLVQLAALVYMITSLVTDENKLLGVFIVIASAVWASNLASIYQYISDPRIRTMGFDRDPNYASAVNIVGIFFTIFLLVRSRTIFLKIVMGLMLLVMLSGQVLTLSRAGIISLGAAALFLTLKQRNKTKSLICIIGVAIIVLLFSPKKFYMRVIRPRTYAESASISNRMLELQTGLNMIAYNPILGVGLGNFGYNYLRYVNYHEQRAAHNTYVDIAAELGLPGLAVFLWLFIKVWLNLRRVQKQAFFRSDFLYHAAFYMEIAFIGYLINAIFISAKFEKFPWILMGISSALISLQHRNRNSISYEKHDN